MEYFHLTRWLLDEPCSLCILYILYLLGVYLGSYVGIMKANDMRPGSGRPGTAGDKGLVSSGIGGTSYQTGGGKSVLLGFTDKLQIGT